MDKKKQVYLPRCVSKQELRHYFGVGPTYLREQLLTEDLISGWGFDYNNYKRKRLLGPRLTAKIYKHFDIKDLNSEPADEIAQPDLPASD